MTIRRRHLWLPLPAVAGCFLLGFATARMTAARPAEAAPAAPASAAPVAAAPVKPADPTFDQKVRPFLDQYCNTCHNSDKSAGGLPLDVYLNTAHAKKDRKTWESVRHAVASGEMPPKKKPQPPADQKQFLLGWIDDALLKIDCAAPKDPGRVTIRRLNRAEYNNTVRDLCGIDFQPADGFPSDDVGYGFDNIGDVLSLQPILLEKYLAAADAVVNRAVVGEQKVASQRQSFGPPPSLQVFPREAIVKEEGDRRRIEFTTDGEAFIKAVGFPADGEYVVRARVWGRKGGDADPKAALRVDGKDVGVEPVKFPKGKAGIVEARVKVQQGERRLAVGLANPSAKGTAKDDLRVLGVERLEVEGPVGGAVLPPPESMRIIMVARPTGPADKLAAAEKVLSTFARRAWRRPVTKEEVARLVKLFQVADGQGESFENALKLPLKAVLVSPHFLFRVEDDPKDPDSVRPIDEHELAARLSYFMWASMPDAELSGLADRGELRKPGVLAAQVKRMLKDPKSEALTQNFAGQWLQLRNLQTLAPDPATFKSFDERLRKAMVRESELFFDHVVKNDRPVLDFLDADYTFVNDRLSWHYGIPNVQGPDFRMVKLTDRRRGGVVTQASVLTVTSNPTRTSPVKRGKWVYENILGLTAPPPAPDVPELPPVGQIKGTLRQIFEQHRANPACANCHAKLDPLGFGLENFDGIGQWRDQDNKQKVDASGVLPDGSKFDGPAEMRKVLLAKADDFRRCLAEKMLTYALGRGLEYYDKCAIDEVVKKLKAGGDKFSALALAVAETDAFQKRKGKRSE